MKIAKKEFIISNIQPLCAKIDPRYNSILVTGIPETNRPGRKLLQLVLGLVLALSMIMASVQEGEIATVRTQVFDQERKNSQYFKA